MYSNPPAYNPNANGAASFNGTAINCPSCGRSVGIPKGTPDGTPIQCGACNQTFPLGGSASPKGGGGKTASAPPAAQAATPQYAMPAGGVPPMQQPMQQPMQPMTMQQPMMQQPLMMPLVVPGAQVLMVSPLQHFFDTPAEMKHSSTFSTSRLMKQDYMSSMEHITRWIYDKAEMLPVIADTRCLDYECKMNLNGFLEPRLFVPTDAPHWNMLQENIERASQAGALNDFGFEVRTRVTVDWKSFEQFVQFVSTDLLVKYPIVGANARFANVKPGVFPDYQARQDFVCDHDETCCMSCHNCCILPCAKCFPLGILARLVRAIMWVFVLIGVCIGAMFTEGGQASGDCYCRCDCCCDKRPGRRTSKKCCECLNMTIYNLPLFLRAKPGANEALIRLYIEGGGGVGGLQRIFAFSEGCKAPPKLLLRDLSAQPLQLAAAPRGSDPVCCICLDNV